MNFTAADITPAGAIFVATIALSLIGFANQKFLNRGLFRPYWFLRRKQYDTVILSGFLHADFFHLLFNMVTFYAFAFGLQWRIGPVLFLLLYALGLVMSEWETYRRHRNDPEYATLGASGAISAVLFASIVYNPTSSLYLMFIPVPIPAWLFAIGYLAYTYYSARNAHDRINHDAHFGGALVGLLFVAVTEPSAYENLLRLFG